MDRVQEQILAEFRRRKIPVVAVFNKSDLGRPDPERTTRLGAEKIGCVEMVATAGSGVLELREALVAATPEDFIHTPPMVADLVPPGELAVLVVPIDKEAPKGRLIQPQVQAIRDLLDGDAYAMVVKERELRDALERLPARRPW